MFLYRPYNISSKDSQPKIPELIFIQEEVNNLKKALKTFQLLMKMIPFYPRPHYKSLQWNGKQDTQYWKKIAVEFIKQKHNTDISRREFPIEMFTGGLPHESFFIALTLQGEIIIRPTKKLVTSYVVGDLLLLD